VSIAAFANASTAASTARTADTIRSPFIDPEWSIRNETTDRALNKQARNATRSSVAALVLAVTMSWGKSRTTGR
jgi:hypothetical protein